MSVFVLDKKKRPLMPMSEKRTRRLLSQRSAIVVKMDPIQIKIDPDSKHTRLALAKESRLIHTKAIQLTVLNFFQINHRGRSISANKEGIVQGINCTCCKLISRNDGYGYEFQTKNQPTTKEQRFLPSPKDGVFALSIA